MLTLVMDKSSRNEYKICINTLLLTNKPHNQLFFQFSDFYRYTDALILAAGDYFLFPLFRKQFNGETRTITNKTPLFLLIALSHLMSKHHFGTQHRKAGEKPTRNKS
jgi:hypothetical protein